MQVVSAPILEAWGCLSDEQIVGKVVAGQTALFEVLMRRHNERLYRAARAIVKDEGEAEDVMRQAYVNAYSRLRQFDGRSQFSTWLTRMAVHDALARARDSGMHPEHASSFTVTAPIASTPDHERLVFSRELGALMESVIDGLPDGAREVFVLRQAEGMCTEDVAAALDVSEAVVETRLADARAALRCELAAQTEAAALTTFSLLHRRCDRVVAAVLARIL